MAVPFLSLREALTLDLGGMPSRLGRLAMRLVLVTCWPWVQVEGRARLRAVDGPAIFVLNHNNSFECAVVPAFLMAARGGRPVSFLVDWMFLKVPVLGRLIRCIEPIPVYNKPARFRLWESYRLAQRDDAPLEAARERLAAGRSLGVFPEGTRNRDPHRLARGRTGLGHLILASEVPVVPIGIVFPAARRLGRAPRLGRITLRVGEPMGFAAERNEGHPLDRREAARRAAAVVAQVMARLAELSGKTYPFEPKEESMRRSDITTVKVLSEADRASALAVVERVYRAEKRWLSAVDLEIPADGGGSRTSWFLTRVKGQPAGVIRLCYDPPLEVPPELDFHFEQGIDLAGMAQSGRFVDIGRFMILPEYRSRIAVVLQLMSAAVREVVARDYTHLITDVFETDPHSPLHFHTRVLGFERIGTHRFGELACESRRIVLVLDIARAYLKLKARKDRVFRELTRGLQEVLEGLAVRRGMQPAA